MKRCTWCETTDKMIRYHDEEWGVPVRDDRRQFEYLMLEVMQCGLSWNLMIEKREIFKACFDDFDYVKIANYTDADVTRILEYPGMIRSEAKVRAVIANAKLFIHITEEFGSFERYLLTFSGDKIILYQGHEKGKIPAKNGLSARISRDLKKRGFKYLGPVVVYSHLQACGIVCDHTADCFRYDFITENYQVVRRRRDGEV